MTAVTDLAASATSGLHLRDKISDLLSIVLLRLASVPQLDWRVVGRGNEEIV